MSTGKLAVQYAAQNQFYWQLHQTACACSTTKQFVEAFFREAGFALDATQAVRKRFIAQLPPDLDELEMALFADKLVEAGLLEWIESK
jgi:hypothetical protein